jgi:hypothetical protein
MNEEINTLCSEMLQAEEAFYAEVHVRRDRIVETMCRRIKRRVNTIIRKRKHRQPVTIEVPWGKDQSFSGKFEIPGDEDHEIFYRESEMLRDLEHLLPWSPMGYRVKNSVKILDRKTFRASAYHVQSTGNTWRDDYKAAHCVVEFWAKDLRALKTLSRHLKISPCLDYSSLEQQLKTAKGELAGKKMRLEHIREVEQATAKRK